MDHLRHQPRALWSARRTDDLAQQSHVRVIEYLHARGWLAGLMALIEATPAFRGRTAVMLVTDFGRGTTADWGSKDTEGAQYVWAAVAAPTWPARGVWKAGHPPASQSQVAATVASLVGKDWKAASPSAGAPLAPPA
jgi:hypothetical protein